jgi:lipoate-protein ligase A
MTVPRIRLLPFEMLSGPANMAADEALLETAQSGIASLRFYAWSEPTVSLGYFQPSQERLPGLPWLRRSTGGAMLVHDREVTYALALPPGKAWQMPGVSWICQFHYLVRDALTPTGVASTVVVCGEEKKLGPALCFLHQTAGDLLSGGSKVVGSAQRKRAGALLQHGGILLETSPATPNLPGIFETTGQRLSTATVVEKVTAELIRTTGWELFPDNWTEHERERRKAIERERYRNPEWNDKR